MLWKLSANDKNVSASTLSNFQSHSLSLFLERKVKGEKCLKRIPCKNRVASSAFPPRQQVSSDFHFSEIESLERERICLEQKEL